MIVVDTSIWIDWFRGKNIPVLDRLTTASTERVILGDIVLLEILQGVSTDAQAARYRRLLQRFKLEAMLTPDLAVIAARNYRALRGFGFTVRRIPDIIIGTFCIECGFPLLQDNRDFQPMADHLGLQLI